MDRTKNICVTLELALQHGLTAEEFSRIIEVLGRIPTITELGIFSVMWSEHCSYKHSIAELKKLPRSGGRLLVSAGEENAGLVDIGGGLAVAFKIESHNHPSAIEPYQGAATGVGGILRDIFTMGARPVAALNSLRFGTIDRPRTRYLMKGIVRGIGDYGNSFGVPTVGGDVFFADCYDENPLVNAMAVGIVEQRHLARAIARGEGNVVMIVGSSTGRDGIHGATFASEEITEKSESRRPSVQVGDPFTEKLLLEGTLEVIQAGLIVGIQDMGAAGIACSTSEMSARGNVGMRIDIERVPVREANMSPYEIMLSESQERMLLVVTPDNENKVREVFRKWDLGCQAIGCVTSDGMLEVREHGQVVACIPAQSLVLGGGAPVYHPRSEMPAYLRSACQLDMESLPEPAEYNQVLLRLLASPNICSRQWISRQYDSMVRTNTLGGAYADAAIIRVKGTSKGLVLKTDCNPRYLFLNPYRGAQIAVAESARNVVCVGATPIAITNCLNFGTPTKPDVFWQFKEAVRGMGDACRTLNTPVTGGNVSFYNESSDGPIYPTTAIGMLGVLEDITKAITASFKNEGDTIVLLGETRGHLGGSEYLYLEHGLVAGDAPDIDLAMERRLHDVLLELIDKQLLNSSHDLSEGGLAIGLAECCIYAFKDGYNLGASITLHHNLRTDQILFGEDQSRAVISFAPKNLRLVQSILDAHTVPFATIGNVVNDRLSVNNWISLRVSQLSTCYLNAMEEELTEID